MGTYATYGELRNMTRSTTARDYPKYMLDILDRMNEGQDVKMELKFTTRKQANSFRLDFYSFRSVAIKEGMESEYPRMRDITITFKEGEPGTLAIWNKDSTAIARIVQEALDKSTGKGEKDVD